MLINRTKFLSRQVSLFRLFDAFCLIAILPLISFFFVWSILNGVIRHAGEYAGYGVVQCIWMQILFSYLAVRSCPSIWRCANQTRREELALTLISPGEYITEHFRKHRWILIVTLLSFTGAFIYAWQALPRTLTDLEFIRVFLPQGISRFLRDNFELIAFEYPFWIQLAGLCVMALLIALLIQMHHSFIRSELLRLIHPGRV